MIQTARQLVTFTLILSLIFAPAQALAAMLIDQLSGHDTASQVNHLSAHDNHQTESQSSRDRVKHDRSLHVDNTQANVHMAVAAHNNQTCDDNQAVCNQCDNCSHCINLIDSSAWRFTGLASDIETFPLGIIPTPDIHLLLRPPIRS